MDLEYLKYHFQEMLNMKANSFYSANQMPHNNQKLSDLIDSAGEIIYELNDDELLNYVVSFYEKDYHILPFINELMDRFHDSIDSVKTQIVAEPSKAFYLINRFIFEDKTLIEEADFISMIQHILKEISLDNIINTKHVEKDAYILELDLLKILINHYGIDYQTEFSQSNFYIIAASLEGNLECFQHLETQGLELSANQLSQTPFDIYFLNHLNQASFMHDSHNKDVLDYLFEQEQRLDIQPTHSHKPSLMKLLIEQNQFKGIEYLEQKGFNYFNPNIDFYMQLIDKALNELHTHPQFSSYQNYCDKYDMMKIQLEKEQLSHTLVNCEKVKKLKI